jgi:hypothetical protein
MTEFCRAIAQLKYIPFRSIPNSPMSGGVIRSPLFRLRRASLWSSAVFLWAVTVLVAHPFTLSSALSTPNNHNRNNNNNDYSHHNYTFPFTAFLRKDFEDSFHRQCDKYPFVDQFVHHLEHPGNRHLLFVYQEPGLRNGGLGDRFGGLLSAVALALRFNRTLVLRDFTGMHEVFRPYHPQHEQQQQQHQQQESSRRRYGWDNWREWSQYDQTLANHDATEYDLWDCINNVGSKNAHCSMLDGDVGQPQILYRSNRAYLCFYRNHPLSVAATQLREMLSGGRGFNGKVKDEQQLHFESANWFEVAGCMLRLVLWPTDTLWAEVDINFAMFAAAHNLDPLLRSFHSDNSASPDNNNYNNNNSNDVGGNQQQVVNNDNDKERSSGHHQHQQQHDQQQQRPFFQLGMHFRCGDRSYIQHGGDSECVFRAGNEAAFPTGNAVGLGLCGKEVIRNQTEWLMQQHRTIVYNDHNKDINNKDIVKDDTDKEPNRLRQRRRNKEGGNDHDVDKTLSSVLPQFMMTFVASDSDAAGEQMGRTAAFPFAMHSPKGCHVEMDSSVACHTFTATQWFLLSLSDVLVTQTLPSHAPTSSFSRYAGIYGLKKDPFRNGNGIECSASLPSNQLHLLQQSNWFC